VTVRGPDGFAITSTPVGTVSKQGSAAAFASSASRTTYVMLSRPAGGGYTISESAGSSAIGSVRIARGLKTLAMKVRVTGKGSKRRLVYKASAHAGAAVELFERAPKSFSRIGAVTQRIGTIRFTPAAGPAGRRQIVALTSVAGVPVEQRVVATYVAPPPGKPGRPGSVRVSRRATAMQITWTPALRATQYLVHVRLDDGRRLVFLRSRATRRVNVSGLRAATTGTITVQALGGGTRGPISRAAVRRAR
jgi:hypothetical protein